MFYNVSLSEPQNISTKDSNSLLNNDWSYIYNIIQDNDTNSDTLDTLSNHEHWIIRYSVARHLNTSEKTLEKLSQDNAWQVRLEVAKNPNTSSDTLKKLTSLHGKEYMSSVDEIPRNALNLRSQLFPNELKATDAILMAQNSKNPQFLNKLSSHTADDVRVTVASNINTAPDTLEKLSKDASAKIRYLVCQHPNTSLDVLGC